MLAPHTNRSPQVWVAGLCAAMIGLTVGVSVGRATRAAPETNLFVQTATTVKPAVWGATPVVRLPPQNLRPVHNADSYVQVAPLQGMRTTDRAGRTRLSESSKSDKRGGPTPPLPRFGLAARPIHRLGPARTTGPCGPEGS